jgi:hypothetical protein
MSQHSENSTAREKNCETKENGIRPRFSYFLCVSCCVHACIYTDNPFPVSCQKNCYISTLFLFQLKIYFLQAEGSPSLLLHLSIIFICSDKHQLLLLRGRRKKNMKNEDMLTKWEDERWAFIVNAARWFSC